MKGKKISKAFAIILAFTMVFTSMPLALLSGGTAYAETGIGSITVDGTTTEYTEYRPLKLDLEKLKNKEVTVEMLTDWDNSISGMTVGERLKIPEGSRTTLNMNGYMFNRDMTKDNSAEDDGEVILVMKGANLTVNGGTRDTSHEAYVYKSISEKSKPVKEDGFKGGLITGGASEDGAGGIHVYEGGNLTLNNVTIAGCRATDKGYGGGIYLDDSTHNVVLNDSIITGCYASEDGGGIYGEKKKDISVELHSSHIDKNFADSDGGGINIDGNEASIVGDGDSSVSENECASRGGGILSYGHKAVISGLEINGNKAKNGGGIYAYKSGLKLEDLVIESNEVSGKGGGVYYNTLDDDDEFQDMVHEAGKVWHYENIANATTQYCMPGNVITDCTIRYNKAERGGGIYQGEGGLSSPYGSEIAVFVCQDISLTGKVIVKDNSSTGDNVYRNLYIAADDWEFGRISTNLSEGSSVWISYYDNDTAETITLTPPKRKDKDSSRYLYSDQDNNQFGWYFKYENGKTDRLRGRRIEKDPPTKVESSDANDASSRTGNNGTKAGKVGTVGAGGSDGGDYSLIRFFSNHESHDFISAVYYSDGLFYGDPYSYNEHLATASWALAYAGGYLVKDEEKDANGNTYYNKHAAARQFLADIGCPDQNIYVNDNMVRMPGADTIGVTIGSKELEKANGEKTGDILIPITVRGLGYEAEWLSNVTLGTVEETSANGKEAKGFASAADKVTAEISYYLKKYNLEDAYKQGKVKFWITGFSRAGATANMTAKRLVEKIENDCAGEKSQVFAYPCEAAKGGTDEAEKFTDKTKYYCIHNMINNADLVPLVGPGEMGFKRYGVDHYIPGSDAGKPEPTSKNVIRGGSGGVSQVTTYADNAAMRTKGAKEDDEESKAYIDQRNKMLKQLTAVDSEFEFDDYFRPMTMNYLEVHVTELSYEAMHQFETGDYENNRIEDFVKDFIRFAQEGQIDPNTVQYYKYPDHNEPASVIDSPPYEGYLYQAIPSRDAWAKNPLVWENTEYPTLQSAIGDMMLLVMTLADKETKGFDGVGDKFMDKLGMEKLLDFYLDVLMMGWFRNSDKGKKYWRDKFWNTLNDDVKAFKTLTPEHKALLSKNFATILNLALVMLDADYSTRPSNNTYKGRTLPQWSNGTSANQMYLATLMNYMDQIISYHLPQLNMAWARTYDSWYDNELTEYTLTPPSNVEVPSAGVERKVDDGEGNLVIETRDLLPRRQNVNIFSGDQKVLLDNKYIVGEAVYYDIFDVTNGENEKQLTANQIFRGSFDLTLGKASRKVYKIETYDMSYGVKSSKETYYLTLLDDSHNVIVNDKEDENGEDRTYSIKAQEGEELSLQAGTSMLHYFKSWKVILLDEQGKELRDVTPEILDAGDQESPAVKFTMPAPSYNYPAGYQLQFTAVYGERITNIKVLSTDPDGTLIDPVAGQMLVKNFAVNPGDPYGYPVTWSYEYSANGRIQTITLPQSEDGYKAYNNTTYIASVTLPQDKENGIMFFEVVNAEIADDDSEGSVTPVLQRNDADGSVELKIIFKPTDTVPEDEGGEDKPDTIQTLAINTVDMNTGTGKEIGNDEGRALYAASPNRTLSVTATNIPGYQFSEWDLGDSGIELVSDGGDNTLQNPTITVKMPDSIGDSVTIDAVYIPVISSVEVNLRKGEDLYEPQGGKTDEHESVELITSVNIGSGAFDRYQVHPDNLSLVWDPGTDSDGIFPFLVQNKATVTIVPDTEGKNKGEVRVRQVDGNGQPAGDYEYAELKMLFAENLQYIFNGNSEGVSADLSQLTVSKIFPATTYILDVVKPLDNITDLEHGKGKDDIEALLPASAKILTENGTELDGEIDWTSVAQTEGSGDARNASVWTATGTVILPATVENPKEIPLEVTMTIGVREADTALMPSTGLDPGTYLYNQTTSLISDEPEGTIYYTTDGSEPTAESQIYDGEEFFIDRGGANLQDELDEEGVPTGRKCFTIKAFTRAEGKWDSDVVTFEYVFSDEVPVPQGEILSYNGGDRIGVAGGLFYTLEPVSEGVTIDGDGNAMAREPGTYKVKAILSDDSMYWAVDPDDPSKNTKEDQTITFSITDIESAVNGLPETVTAEDAAAIEAARALYDSLSDEDKKALPKDILPKLETAEAKLTAVVLAEAAEAVRALAANVLDASKVKTGDYKTSTADPFKAALKAAKDVLIAAADATAAEMKAANAALTAASGELVLKAANPITVKGKTATVRASKLRKKSQKVARKKALVIKNSQGKLSFKKVSGNKKIKISKSTGKITVGKGLKKGTYKIKVKVTAAGNDNYKAKTVTKIFKIKVK